LPLVTARCALVLEPSPAKRQMLRRVLRRHGFTRVLEAGTSAAALVQMRGEPVHLVLTAWAPPGFSGVPLLKALQRTPGARPGGAEAPVVVLLDEGLSQAQRVAAVKAGVAGYLTLPAQSADLARILGSYSETGTPSAEGASAAPQGLDLPAGGG
jgi:CheY-like chemotaxis protein